MNIAALPQTASVSPSSFASTFTTTTGTASSTQTATYTFVNVTGSDAQISFPAWSEVSLDGGTTWNSVSPITGLGNCSGCTLTARLSASASAGSYGPDFFTFTAGSSTATIQGSAIVNALVSKDSITVQFDTLTANQEVASYVKHMTGMMHQMPARTCTGGNSNTIIVTAIPANWTPSGGNTQFPSDGITNGTAWPWLTKIQRECAFQASSNSYTPGSYQIDVAGLNPSSTYRVEFTASVNPSTLNAQCGSDFRVEGSSLYGPTTLVAQTGGVANVSNKATFATCSPTSGGHLHFYLAASAGATIATISGFRLIEN